METPTSKAALATTFRVLVVLLILWATLPIYFTQISSGLDASWIYAVNVAGPMGLKFGEDIFFTFGPLGFLSRCIAVGNNTVLYFVYYGILFGLLAYLLREAIVRLRLCSLPAAALSAVLISHAGTIEADYYVSYILLLALSLAWFGDKKLLYFSIACVLASVMLFIKFSGSALVLSVLFMFVGIHIVDDRRAGLRYLSLALCVPVIFVVGYLLYNPSVEGMKDYVLGAAELISGYSTAMSQPPTIGALGLALALLICFGGSLLLVLWADRQKGFYLLSFCGAFFMAFKHGFVRADHAPIFFSTSLLWLSLFAIFLDFGRLRSFFAPRKAWACMLAIMLLLQLFLPIYFLRHLPGNHTGTLQTQLSRIAGVKDMLSAPVEAGGRRLPEDFLAEIGNSSVAIFPFEQSIAAHNDLRVVFMPLLQTYSAYTPRLDAINAAFFAGTDDSPRYVIFDLESMDGRLALIDCPLTWLELFSNYSAVRLQRSYLLLERTQTPFAKDFIPRATTECRISDTISVPESATLVAMEIDMELNLLGRLRKFFYQVPPEFYIELHYETGATLRGRVIPENLAGPTVINFHPNSLPMAAVLMNIGRLSDAVESIQFSGRSLRYYRPYISVGFSESRTLKPAQGPCAGMPQQVEYPLDGLTRSGARTFYNIDLINGIAPTRDIHLDRRAGLHIEGWVLDFPRRAVPSRVFLKLGTTYYRIPQQDRPDIGDHFRTPAFSEGGIDGYVSLDAFAPGSYPASLIAVSRDGSEYYEFPDLCVLHLE